MKIEYLKTSEIVPYKKNPRKNKQAIEIVAKSIAEYGFKNPIIIDKEKVIIAGHTRIEAVPRAIELIEEKLKDNLKENDEEILQKRLNELKEGVPTIRIEDLTEDQIKAYRIMDNKSSEYAEWDTELLKEEFMELEAEDYDLELTGFDLSEIGDILDTEEKEDIGKVDKLGHLEVECPKCHHKFQRKDA